MRVIPCKAEHMRAIDGCLSDAGRDLLRETADQQPEVLAEWARTLEHEDQILACFGIAILWPGVAHAWALISEAAKAYPLSLTRSVLHQIRWLESLGGFRRIEAAVLLENERGHRWIKILGFEMEGLLKNYGLHGEGDYVIYARIN